MATASRASICDALSTIGSQDGTGTSICCSNFSPHLEIVPDLRVFQPCSWPSNNRASTLFPLPCLILSANPGCSSSRMSMVGTISSTLSGSVAGLASMGDSLGSSIRSNVRSLEIEQRRQHSKWILRRKPSRFTFLDPEVHHAVNCDDPLNSPFAAGECLGSGVCQRHTAEEPLRVSVDGAVPSLSRALASSQVIASSTSSTGLGKK